MKIFSCDLLFLEEPATPIGINKIHPGLMKSGFVTLGFKFKISCGLEWNKLAIVIRVSSSCTE
jgi:hypothetical protein